MEFFLLHWLNIIPIEIPNSFIFIPNNKTRHYKWENKNKSKKVKHVFFLVEKIKITICSSHTELAIIRQFSRSALAQKLAFFFLVLTDETRQVLFSLLVCTLTNRFNFLFAWLFGFGFLHLVNIIFR